jgi:CRP/FNR family cyclic AMP-dependent transcriptional regulator
MIQAHPFHRPRGFRCLIPTDAWTQLVKHGIRAHHDARKRLLHQGDREDWVLFSLSGRLRVVYAEPNGAEIVLAIRGPGDVIGELSAQDGLPRSATVQAIEPGITSKVPRRRFNDLIQQLGLGRRLEGYITGKLRESGPHTWQLAHHATATRLTALIIAIIDAAGPDHPSPTTIALSQEELASALGLVRSAVTPVLRDWKSAGLIRITRGRLEIVNVTALTGLPTSISGQTSARPPGRLLPGQVTTSTEEDQ